MYEEKPKGRPNSGQVAAISSLITAISMVVLVVGSLVINYTNTNSSPISAQPEQITFMYRNNGQCAEVYTQVPRDWYMNDGMTEDTEGSISLRITANGLYVIDQNGSVVFPIYGKSYDYSEVLSIDLHVDERTLLITTLDDEGYNVHFHDIVNQIHLGGYSGLKARWSPDGSMFTTHNPITGLIDFEYSHVDGYNDSIWEPNRFDPGCRIYRYDA